MRYTTLGRTGLTVSTVGFGGIPIRRLGRPEAIEIVRRAVDLGVTFFDTAKGYGDSEEMIGEALEGMRHQVVLATKTPSRTRDEAAADLAQSLRRLRTDYIDLYQLHNVYNQALWEQVMGPGGAMETLRAARKAGTIGHIGFTSHGRQTARRAIDSGEFSTLMVPFSHLETEASAELLPASQAAHVAFIAMKPFSGGALDHPVQCLKWVLGQGATVALPGIGSLAELAEDVAVADLDWTLSPAELAAMEEARTATGATFCRGCDYCQPCPNEVSIATVLRSTNLFRRAGEGSMGNGQYERIVAWVEDCTECRECEPRCPYHLPVPDLMRERLEELRTALRGLGWQV